MKKWLLIIPVIACFLTSFGQTKSLDEIIKNKPVPIQYVHDHTGKMSTAQVQHLDQKLRKYDDSTSVQIAVLLINSLEGKSIEDVGIEIGRSWGVGNKGVDNGVVIIASINDRKIRIETGSRIEAQVTDYISGEIIDNDIKPNFRAEKYYEGLEAATDDIIKAVAGTYKAPSGYHKNKKSGMDRFYGLMIMIFIVFIVLGAVSKGGKGGGGMVSRRGYSDWVPPVFWGGGGSSGGGSSSSGGGWSGGFGGGGFSGGGASGDW